MNKITDPGFVYLEDKDKFRFLMSCFDPVILSWFEKYVHQSFDIRNEKLYGFA